MLGVSSNGVFNMIYKIIELIVVILSLVGIIFASIVKSKYKNSNFKQEIINYFKEMGATSLEKGIYVKDLPTNIYKSSYLIFMLHDKTLSFEEGKYYLNDK